MLFSVQATTGGILQKGLVLCVDDDNDLQVVLSHYLEEEGYKVICANSLQTALEKNEQTVFDVILLDLRLPDGEGNTLIPKLKEKSGSALIVLSGKSDTTDKIVCLEMGADDYLTKPFELKELLARIKAVMRRIGNHNDIPDGQSRLRDSDRLEFGDGWCLVRAQYQLYNKENISADLTTGEFKLLEALILSPNRALSREHLFDLTRDGEFDVYDRAIDIQIARIRKKMSDGSGDELIKTVRGVGYMFSGEVKKN